MCKVFKIPRSTLYYKKKKIIPDIILKTKIKLIHIFDPHYWYRRVAYSLWVNKKRSSRIMQIYELYGKTKKRRKFSKPNDKNLPNMWVINKKKGINISKVNQVWSSDFTHLYFKWKEFYLSTIIDEFSKEITWFNLWFSHTKELIIWAIDDAFNKSNIVPELLHSDQWSEYRSYEYFNALKEYNISASMSKKSSPWENSVQESFYWKFKYELGNLNRFENMWEVIEEIYLKIHYYNNFRIHTTLKMSPREFINKHKNLDYSGENIVSK